MHSESQQSANSIVRHVGSLPARVITAKSALPQINSVEKTLSAHE